MENKENKSVFVIVRETHEFKVDLEEKSKKEGFGTLSEYIRYMWRKWL